MVALLLVFALFAASTHAQPVTNAVVSFQTLGSTFSPALEFGGTPLDLCLWFWSDGTTDSSLSPSKDFGSAGPRLQTLAVDPPASMTAINLGFDGSDGGWTNSFTNQSSQEVAQLTFEKPLPNLQLWASSYNPITNTLGFSGFTSLQDVECFHCSNLQHVAVSSLPSLRRLCFEDCLLHELDISNDPNLEDMRSALNAFTSVKIGGGTGPKIWHWCFRDNPQITQHFQQIMTNFFSLQELWIWNANQSGSLTFVSTNLTDVEVHHNAYTYADFRGQTNLVICQINDNRLTNLLLDGCRSLETLEAQNNQLTTAALDRILATLDNPSFAIRSINLAGNAKLASAAGLVHYANLTQRGVFVNLDLPNANPFAPFAGSYNGLFYESNVLHATSGSIGLTLRDRGTFTGSLWLAGKRYSLSGQFDSNGNSAVILSAAGGPITGSLVLDMSPGADRVSGSVGNGSWLASLEAVRAGFDARSHPATNYSGPYTIVFPGSPSGGGLPEGNGYGTMKVDGSGKGTVTGALGDAMPYAYNARLSAEGEFPIYISLYGGKGSILGWLTFSSQALSDLNGDLTWTRPAIPASRLYSAGFITNDQVCVGSRYQKPMVQNRTIDFTNGFAAFSGGNLSAPFTNSVALTSSNKISNQSENRLTLSIALATGAFNGSVVPPGSTKSMSFKGVVLQKQNAGFGLFSGTNQTGAMTLQPADN
jgi:hypothetical protein